MLLAGALSALLMTGFWLYCLTDAILTPAPECRGLPKPAWIAVIALTFAGGAIAWLFVKEPVRHEPGPLSPRMAGCYGPPEPAEPGGPDDDPEFLRALDRAIRGNSQAGEV